MLKFKMKSEYHHRFPGINLDLLHAGVTGPWCFVGRSENKVAASAIKMTFHF